MIRNRFRIVCKGWTPEGREWNVHEPPPADFLPDTNYFGSLLAEVDRLLPNAGLIFCVVWSLDQVPCTGNNVVVFLLGEEKYQVPSYQRQVLAVFKTMGHRPFRTFQSVLPVRKFKALDLLKDGRNLALRTVRGFRGVPDYASVQDRLFPVPLGYYKQIDLPFKPFDERSIDIFFAGKTTSMISPFAPSTWTFSPGIHARAALANQIKALRKSLTGARIEDAFFTAKNPTPLSPIAYSEKLMDTRISLCPRGSFPETFRMFESARAGCVIVAEPVPDCWYYDNSPVITVPYWDRSLIDVIEGLLSDPLALTRRSAATRDWYDRAISPQAVARYVTAKLKELHRPSVE